MTHNIHYDVSAIIIFLVLLFSVYFRKLIKGNQSTTFFIMIIVCIVCTVADIFSAIPELGYTSVYVSTSIYYILRNLCSLLYLIYIIHLTDTWHFFKKKKYFIMLALIPYIIVFITVLTNPFTNLVFTVENNDYVRGPLLLLLYICSGSYLLAGAIYLFSFRRLVSKFKAVATYSIFVFTIVSLLIQYFFPTYLVEMFATSVALLFVSVTIQRPEELIDTQTGLGHYKAYANTMQRKYMIRKETDVIFVKISNFSILMTLLKYDQTNLFIRNICSEMQNFCKGIDSSCELYALDRGHFAIVINEVDKNTSDIAKGVFDMLNKKYKIFNTEINLIASICIASIPKDLSKFKSLITFGENYFNTEDNSHEIVYVSALKNTMKFSMINEIDSIIERGLLNHRFEVYYQPIYSTKNKRFSSCEALLRLNDSKYGNVSPDIFIPAAEKNGSIHEIGDFVIEEVCKFIAGEEYKKLGLEYIEVNLSTIQCMDSKLASKILNCVKKYNISPKSLNLEITETAIKYFEKVMLENIEVLHKAGITFSLDDYGTGYSNIMRVASLPLNIIKLDKSMAMEYKNPKVGIVLDNTINMIKDLDLEVVVEGVETKEMLDTFIDFDCEYIQGYYYSKPLPKEEFIKFLQDADK